MNLLIITGLIAAAVVLCGYTTVRLPVRREEGKRHIACVGDSVTYGCTLPLFFLRRYPAVLRRLIGPGAQAAAFAVNDRTLQDTGNKPFRKERAFRQSREFGPDTVVILYFRKECRFGLPSRCFDEYIDAEFEGRSFRIVKDYDTFLTLKYGDYMTPPPPDKITYYPVGRIVFPDE